MNSPEADDAEASGPPTGAVEAGRCSSCRAPLTADAIGGVCPRCMFDAALSDPGDAVDVLADAAPEIDGYRMIRELGRGGMGVVWLAEQTATMQIVAVKFCQAVRAPLDGAVAILVRFQREMELAARFKHPQFARVLGGGEVEGVPYCVMEYVEGQELGAHVRTHGLSRERIVELVEKVCRAVEHAHAAQVIHRDLKPSNILVTAAGEPKVLDFGLAKALADDRPGAESPTLTGHRLGTPAYMSPEQVQGRALDPASDVFSLGVMLFEMLTGQHPHGGGSSEELMHRIATEEPMRPRVAEASVDRVLELILLKALARAAADRHRTAGALAEDLARWRRGERPSVGGTWAWAPYLSRRWLRSHRVLAWALGVGVVLSIVAIGWNRWVALAQRRLTSEVAVRAALLEREKRDGKPSLALAHLAAALQRDPANHAAATEAYSQLVRTRDSVAPWSATPALRHGDRVWQAAFRADGRRVITASFDGTAQVWDAAVGQAVGARLRHDGPVVEAVFSPDGKVVATASNDGTARLWEVESGAPRGAPLRHGNRVTSVVFAPGGQRIATASEDHTARLWDVASGRPADWKMEHADAVNAIAFSPDGSRLVSASGDKTARLWDAETGESLGSPLEHGGRVTAASFSPDGRLVLTVCDASAQLWDTATGQAGGAPLVHEQPLNAASFSPDGTRIVTAGQSGHAVVWDIRPGGEAEKAGLAMLHPSPVLDARFNADGCLLVTAAQDGTARVWDAETGEAVALPFVHGAAIRSVEFSADGLTILTASDDRTARLWQWSAGHSAERRLRHGGPVTRAVFSGDSRTLLTACWDGEVRVWNVETGVLAGVPLSHPGRVAWAEFSPDRTRIVSAAGSQATLWDAKTGRAAEPRLLHEAWITSATFSPDGARILTASEDATARLWDARTGQPAALPIKHEGGAVRRACFTDDGRWIVTACADRVVRLWDAHTLREGPKFTEHRQRVRSVAPGLEGAWVVSAGDDPSAWVWHPKTGRYWSLPHGASVPSAVFSADGRRIVTAGHDGAARLWNAATGGPWGAPLHHTPADQVPIDISGPATHEVWDASFSPDGRWIATAGADWTARLWEDGVPPERAPSWVPRLLTTLAGCELTADGSPRPLPHEERQRAREDLQQMRAYGSPWAHLRRWALADPRARTISPHCALSVVEHVEREILWVVEQRAADLAATDLRALEACTAAAREAWRLHPAHPLIHFALGACRPEDRQRATFLYDYGLAHLPRREAVCLQAEKILRSLQENARADQAAVKAAAAEARGPAR